MVAHKRYCRGSLERIAGILTCIVLVSSFSPVNAGGAFDSPMPPGVVFELLALNKDLPTGKTPRYLSPTDIKVSANGGFLYVAEQTAKRIDVVDLGSNSVTERIRLPNEVTGIAVANGGGMLYATCSSELWPAGMVCVVDLASGRVVRRIGVGSGARSPVLTPDEGRLFVCNRFDNTVSEVNCATFSEVKRIRVVREPYCADITSDGKTLVVGNLLPGGVSNDTLRHTSMITVIAVEKGAVVKNVPLGNGTHNVAGIAISADDQYALATNLIGKNTMPGTTVERGWLHKNDLAVIDLKKMELINNVSLDLANVGMADPWAVRCTNDGSYVVVSHAGANGLSIIDYKSFIDTVLARTARGENLIKDFTVMTSSRNRIDLKQECPRALAVSGGKVYVAGYYSDMPAAIDAYDLSLTAKESTGKILLDNGSPQTSARKGEANFCDASLCFQKWQSCNSCHPFSRTDGRNWILGGGAVIAPKNTKSVVYSWWTAPTTWTGRRGSAQTSIAAGIELELFRVATRELTAPLDTFFMGMKPLASPYLEKGRLSTAAQQGKAVFNGEKAQCVRCHPAPLFTDSLFWNAEVPDPFDANTQWVTPSLVEAWRNGPYGHLGSFETVQEMVGKMVERFSGSTLSESELNSLVEFVLSL